MTEKQKKQFNLMLLTLRTIGKDYSTPKQLIKESQKEWGLDYQEALEMAYENIQYRAKSSIKGIKFIE